MQKPGKSATYSRGPLGGRAGRAGAAPGILLPICWFWVDLRFESFGFRTARTPIGRWKRGVPESWARVDKLCPYSCNSRLSRVAFGHCAADFSTRQNVTRVRFCPALAGSRSRMICAARAHHFGLAPFGKSRAIYLFAMHDDSHTEKDALAPPLAGGISGPRRAERAHNPPSLLRRVTCTAAAKCSLQKV